MRRRLREVVEQSLKARVRIGDVVQRLANDVEPALPFADLVDSPVGLGVDHLLFAERMTKAFADDLGFELAAESASDGEVRRRDRIRGADQHTDGIQRHGANSLFVLRMHR
ncbi:MAG: hypothetical protein U0744_02240 [Gemmataceae bacterium]